jgi:hypothetical protein
LEVTSFRQGKKRDGANVGDGSSLREGHGDGRGRHVIGKFGDDEYIERAESEEGGLELTAKLFDGRADGFKTVKGIVKKPIAGVCGVTDLMAKEGHQLPLSRGWAATYLRCACGMRMSSEGKMKNLCGTE